MTEIRVDAGSFDLSSSYYCIYEIVDDNVIDAYTTEVTTGTKNVEFTFALPAGAKVHGATINATLGSALYESAICKINGTACSYGATVSIPVEIEDGSTSVTVPFVFQIKSPLHRNHGNAESTEHSGSLKFSNVYLLIETTGGCVFRAENGALVPYQLYHAESGELVPYQLFKCVNIEEESSRIAQIMQSEYSQANVDLLNRPRVDAAIMNAAGWDVPDGSYSTVDTVTYTSGDFDLSDDYAINVTPIFADGTVINGGVDGLWEFINNELNNGKQFEELDIFLGKYDTVEEAEAAAIRLHELQEDYYALKEETSENRLVQY